MKRLTAIVCLAAALICAGCKSATPDEVAAMRLDSLLTASFPADAPGAAMIVLRGDDVIFSKGYGLADMETKAPIDCNTFFNIASMSKQFTAVAILKLAEEGKISLDDSMSKYYPEFKGEFWKDIQIHHLLSHSSGIPDARGGIPREEKIKATDSLAIAFFNDLDHVDALPGERYSYCNPTYTLLGDLITRVTGQEFGEYMRENIFTPAGMEKTLYYVPGHEDEIPAMAHGYTFEDGAWQEEDYGETTFFATRPDGGIYTSVNEFVNWEKAIRNCSVISAESIAEAQSGKIMENESPRRDYGYGWIVEQNEDIPAVCIFHAGGNGGFRSFGVRYPESNTFWAIFTNRSDFRWQEYKPQFEKILFNL